MDRGSYTYIAGRCCSTHKDMCRRTYSSWGEQHFNDFCSGCPNIEIWLLLLIKCLIIGTCPYYGADSATLLVHSWGPQHKPETLNVNKLRHKKPRNKFIRERRQRREFTSGEWLKTVVYVQKQHFEVRFSNPYDIKRPKSLGNVFESSTSQNTYPVSANLALICE
jgi:hypothetical protein